MNTMLKVLFDYQKFDPEPALQSVIDSVHGSLGSARVLSDDEAEIWAAGEADPSIGPLLDERYDKG